MRTVFTKHGLKKNKKRIYLLIVGWLRGGLATTSEAAKPKATKKVHPELSGEGPQAVGVKTRSTTWRHVCVSVCVCVELAPFLRQQPIRWYLHNRFEIW